MDLYVVSGGNEFPAGHPFYNDRLYVNEGNGNFIKSSDALPMEKNIISGKKVVSADIDLDGDLDLFIGGRITPGHYPIIPESQILLNETASGHIHFKDVTSQMSNELLKPGMVTDASWVDVNQDSWPDLVLVGEWMPIRVFANQKGKRFEEISDQLGLSQSQGWWTSLLVDDVDSDGDVDFLVGNAGANLQYDADFNHPLELFVKDINKDGEIDPIMSYYIGDQRYPVHSYDEMVDQMKSFRKQYGTYEAYANATTDEVLGMKENSTQTPYKIVHLKSSCFINDGQKMLQHSLPYSLQQSMVNAFVKDDFDGDGQSEILCVGNFFPYRVEWGPSDAFFGALIQWRNGQMECQGLKTLFEGDIRGASLVHTNTGKRVIISRNNDDTSLYAY